MRIAGLVLAAGESKRLERPKQLVKYRDRTLLNIAIQTLLDTGIKDVFVVLGSQRTRIASSILSSGVITIYNDEWKEGMGSSLSTGVKAIKFDNHVDGVLIMLCDQPKVSVDHLNALINSANQNEKIICSEYNGIYGAPAIFPKSYFAELMLLKEDEGARKVISKYADKISIPCKECAIDIDTQEDLSQLN